MFVNVPGVIVDGTSPATVAPTATNLVLYQGMDTTIQVTITGLNGTAINITGYSGLLTIKDRLLPSTGAPKTSKTYNGTVTNGPGGLMQFTIPGSDLKSLLLQSYFWDVFTTNGSGGRDEVVLTGTLTVNGAVGA